jgi:hypothetical protein
MTNLREDELSSSGYKYISSKADEIGVQDSRGLHEVQLAPRNLSYEEERQVGEVSIHKTDAVSFPLNPDERILDVLQSIGPDDNKVVRYRKLLNAVLFKGGQMINLVLRGIRSGLSHGTMDIIYRLDTPRRVEEVLDNLNIAVGALQRRLIVSDLIAKVLKQGNQDEVVSIAGGSCLLPIEGVYQSGVEGVQVTNIDSSPDAYSKAEATLAMINQRENRGTRLQYVERDILGEGLGIRPDDETSQVFECTGFWEYLTIEERHSLLEQVSASLGPDDIFVFTALVNNPQQDIFDAMKFKRLMPHPAEELIPMVQEHFDVDFATLNGNDTYLTLILRSKN